MINNFTTVKIPVIKILEYFDNGVEVRILSRPDMIQIHKDIEAYLGEWRDYLRVAINLSLHESKDMLLGLEKLSKHIYEKAKPREVIDELINRKSFGIMNPVEARRLEKQEVVKPSYEGIGKLLKQRLKSSGTGGTTNSRF